METNVFFSAVQSALDMYIKRMVEEAVAPLLERIAALEEGCVGIDQRLLEQRVALLETKLTEAKLFEQTTNVTIPIDEAKMVEALNSQEWFWEKLHNTINDNVVSRVEEALDDHCSTYDHDQYDEVYNEWGGESVDDFVKDGYVEDQIEEKVNETLRNATFSISI